MTISFFIVGRLMLGSTAYLYLRRTEEMMSQRISAAGVEFGMDRSDTMGTVSQSRISTRPSHGACRAALALEDTRFLGDESPPIPLSTCDARRCQCRYEPHGEFRGYGDRRIRCRGSGGFAVDGSGGEQRVPEDRRSD